MDELAAIADVVNPNEKLACILNSARVIIYQLQSGGSAASADDFLPHLIWVVMHAGVTRMHAHCAYIREYAAPDALRMEAQYFFTNIEIATTWLAEAAHDASSFQIDPTEFATKMAAAEQLEKQQNRSFGFFRRRKLFTSSKSIEI